MTARMDAFTELAFLLGEVGKEIERNPDAKPIVEGLFIMREAHPEAFVALRAAINVIGKQ